MKKVLLIFLFSYFCNSFLLAQPAGKQGQGTQSGSGTEKTQDSKAKVKSEIYSFRLENQSSLITLVPVDTATLGFHNYSPMFQKGISNTYLGYTGAPYISNDFFDRLEYADYYFNSSMKAYIRNQRDVKYYNTTTPFSFLKYDESIIGGTEKEQIFNAFLTQNVDSVTNFGFNFDVIKGVGQYSFQKATHKNLNFFISRNSKRYNGYASFITETDNMTENGGITQLTFNPWRTPGNLAVNLLSGITPEIKTFSFFTSHEYLLGEIPFLKSKLEPDSVFIPRYGIQYAANISNYKRNFTETAVTSDFFDATYFSNKAGRYDSSSFQRITQTVQLRMLENPLRKFTFGKRAYLENEIVAAMHPVYDGKRKYNYSNLFVGGEIYNRSNRFLWWSATARFVLLGRNLGDAILKGTLHKPLYIFGDTLALHVEGWYQDISPDIFQEHWQDNHFKWENKFDKQHEVVFKGRADWDKIHFHAGANYAMMSNFLYNGKDAKPTQYSGAFSVLGIWLSKEFVLGPIRWNNKFFWQKSTSNVAVHLPMLNCYSSISVNGILFKVMKYQIGSEVYYNSSFYADNYEPSTSSFYIQESIATGNYPQVNVFVNAKLKRTSAFVVWNHCNSYITGGKYFSSPYYPIDPMSLRFGLLWSFYN